jgi:CRISPR-associated endonuclease/helicase Cas3
MSIQTFDGYWAKSDGVTTLPMHTQHVVVAARNLLKRLSLTEAERMYWDEKLHRCAVLHDLGKIHIAFQKRLAGTGNTSIRHEILSLWFCESFLELSEDELFAIATHHKGVARPDSTGRLDKVVLIDHVQEHLAAEPHLFNRETLDAWLKCMQLNLSVCEKERLDEISSRIVRLLANKQQAKVMPDVRERQKLSFMRALLIAADHIGSARQEEEIPEHKSIAVYDFQPSTSAGLLPFRAFQKKLQYITTDVILHAPTGSGKTEAALSWVFANQTENARLFYLLPYTASINAMVTRLQKVYGEDKVTALHSKTLDFFYQQLSEEESNLLEEVDYEKIEQLSRSRKALSAELFYPVKVATLHQVLKTSLKGKGWELALYDYKNALFIIDEFHTYNALLTGMLLASVKLFKRLFNAKFFFMSATIPEFMLHIIIREVFAGDSSYLIRPDYKEGSDKEILHRKRHQLYLKPEYSVLDDIGEIEKTLSEGKSVLVIVNNVKTAQTFYKEIYFKGSVKLLHSGFHRKGRSEIEQSITHEDKSKRPQLLIATQAVEVSLDIDYDVAFIENAPIDALIQRFGRVNRAGKKGVAPVYLYQNIVGNTPFYDKEVLNKTWTALDKLNEQVLSEQDLVDVCNGVYVDGYNELLQQDFLQGLNHSVITDFESDWIAGDWNNWIEEILENNNQKVEILCGNLEEEFDEYKSQKRYIEANQLLVSVYYYELKGTNFRKDERRNVLVAYDLEYDPIIGYSKKVHTFDDVCL